MAPPRLPVPGSDNGTWGDLLNEFLNVAHNADGAAKDASATAKGAVQLAGDLGGTAAAPTVPGLADKAPLAHNHDGTYAKPRGAWAASTAYAVNDLVLHGGKSYRCTTAHTSTSSFDAAKWEQLGTAGVNVTVATTAPAAPSYGDLWIKTA